MESPETGSQNLRYRDLSRRQRPHARYLDRGNARILRAILQRPGNAGSHRTAWWRTHSHSNLSPHPNSRLSGKITGNFVNWMLDRLFAGVKQPTFLGVCAKIPCEIESGIFCREPGHFRQANGKFSRDSWKGPVTSMRKHAGSSVRLLARAHGRFCWMVASRW